jgi:hypothetical protein
MINKEEMFDNELLWARMSRVERTSVKVPASLDEGLTPISDGDGGFTWGIPSSQIIAATDSDSDGNVVITITEAS